MPRSSRMSSTSQKEMREKALATVVSKLQKLKGLENLSKEELMKKAKNIAFKEDLMETYLNENFVAIQKTVCMIHWLIIFEKYAELNKLSDVITNNRRSILPKSQAKSVPEKVNYYFNF